MTMERRYLYLLTSFLFATFISLLPLNSSFGASLKDSFEQENSDKMNDIRLFIEEMRDEFDFHWNGFIEVFDIDETSEANTSGLLLQFTEYNMGSIAVGACKEYAEDLYNLLIVDDLVVRVSEKYYKKRPRGFGSTGYPAVVTLQPLSKFSEDRTTLIPIYEDEFGGQCLIEFSEAIPDTWISGIDGVDFYFASARGGELAPNTKIYKGHSASFDDFFIARAASRFLQDVHFRIKMARDFSPEEISSEFADYMFAKTRQEEVRDFCFYISNEFPNAIGKPNC